MNDREIRCYSGEVRAERHDDTRRTLSVMDRCLTVVLS